MFIHDPVNQSQSGACFPLALFRFLSELAVNNDSQTVIVMSAIDNLVRGAAGQAVSNMNLMYGLEETAGLKGLTLFP